MTTPVWCTNDGREMPIAEMTTPHLENALAIVESSLGDVTEAPEYAAGDAAALIQAMHWQTLADALRAEAWRRGRP